MGMLNQIEKRISTSFNNKKGISIQVKENKETFVLEHEDTMLSPSFEEAIIVSETEEDKPKKIIKKKKEDITTDTAEKEVSDIITE